MINRYKAIQVQIVLLVLYLFQTGSSQAPISFGIILKHQREGDIFAIQSYIDRFNNPKCEGISEISIVSSESYQVDVKKMNQRLSISTSIPLHLAFIKEDSIFSKFIIPEASQSQFFYIGNILSQQTCEEITKHIQKAVSLMIGGIIPIVGQQNEQSVIAVDNTVKAQSQVFNYDKNAAYGLFQIVENIRIISKHTIQLSKSKIIEVELMSKEVSPACQEIFMNFIASHFYPEIKNRYFSFQNKLTSDKSQQSHNEKSLCVKKFISILGYCPLYYQNKLFNVTLWKNPQEEKVVDLKKVDLIGKLAQFQEGQRRFLSAIKLQPEKSQSTLTSLYSSSNKLAICCFLLVMIGVIMKMVLSLRVQLKFLKSCLQQVE